MGEPGGAGPIGPYPPGVDDRGQQDEYDRLRRRVLWTLPSGLYVVGSRAGERRNGMTINWVTQVVRPEAAGHQRREDGVHPRAHRRGRRLRPQHVAREDRAIVRKFTKPVEVDIDARTLNGFPFHDGAHRRADPRPGRRRTSTARSARPSRSATTRCSSARSSTPASRPTRTPTVLRMEDTRMNYGG